MIRLEPAGAEALLLVLAEQPDARLPQRLALLAERIRVELGAVLTDLVPSWTSLLLHYDLSRSDHLQLTARLTPLLERWLAEPLALPAGRLHEIPIWYAGADLAEVARQCRLRVEQVIELHCSREYRVGAIGFAPGFAYLGELPERLALPASFARALSVPWPYQPDYRAAPLLRVIGGGDAPRFAPVGLADAQAELRELYRFFGR